MVSRERILEAAARVYAKHGFKGATTRLIAIEAEVNEVTLFRTFGSKGALLRAVLLQHVGCQGPAVALPTDPQDPVAEVRAFVEETLQQIGDLRPILIQTMGEAEDRPDAHEFACRGRQQVHGIVTSYLRQLVAKGWVPSDLDIDGAGVVLTGAIIADVMGRPIIPDVYPPRNEVAERYTALFLRAIGFDAKLAAAEQSPKPARTPNHSAPPAVLPSQPLHSTHS